MTNAPTPRETADHAELARLAEAAAKGEWWSDDDVISHQEVSREDERFIYAFTPAVCSALLSEIAALRGEREADMEAMAEAGQNLQSQRIALVQAERQRDEAVGLLRRWENAWRSGASVASIVRDQAPLLANQGAE